MEITPEKNTPSLKIENTSKKYSPFFEITIDDLNDDLASYGLAKTKVGEKYCLEVVEREKNRIGFNLVKINENP